MYMSRIKLNLSKRDTILALTNPQMIHGALEVNRPREENDHNRLLWRIDKLNNEYYLIVVSQEKPKLRQVGEQFGSGSESIETRDYDQLLDRIHNGSRWVFRLTVNPSKAAGNNRDSTGRGRRVARSSEKYLREWLQKKSVKNGFSVEEGAYKCVSVQRVQFQKKHRGKPVSFIEATFEGILEVTDEALFKKMLCHGIGKEKAYGMGLMTILPVS